MTAAPTAQPAAATGGGLRRVLAALCVTQVTSWGVLYYAFPVLSGRISADTGWAPSALAAAFSAGLVVSALLGVVVGRWLDRHGPRWLMTLGSLVAAAAVVAIAAAPTLGWFVAAWLLAGVAMSAVLYPPAFAALTRWYGSRAVGALTILTLAGGLASTIFAPITAALAGQLGWRGTYLVLAVVLALVTVPCHMLDLTRPWPAAPPMTHLRQAPDRVVRSPSFLALGTALALAACASYAVVVNLVPLLTERNLPLGVAAFALALGGSGQVMGRLGYRQLSRRTGVRTRTTLTLAGVAVTTALLAAVTSLAAVLVMAVAAGAVRGIATLVQATAVTDRWGDSHYGRLSGVLAAPVTVTAAVAPWVGAALAGLLGSYAAMFWVMASLPRRPYWVWRRFPPRAPGSQVSGRDPSRPSSARTRRSMSSRTRRVRSIPSMPRSDGPSVSQFSNRCPSPAPPPPPDPRSRPGLPTVRRRR